MELNQCVCTPASSYLQFYSITIYAWSYAERKITTSDAFPVFVYMFFWHAMLFVKYNKI
jgi:hypothetical protein